MADENIRQFQSKAERELKEREERIERAEKGYVVLGNELAAIRDSDPPLYRDRYQTFDQYCKQRWEMTRQRAYQLIEIAQVVAEMSKIFDILPIRESHVRALMVLKNEDRAGVWGKVLAAVDRDPQRVRAKTVNEAVTKFMPKKTNTGPGRPPGSGKKNTDNTSRRELENPIINKVRQHIRPAMEAGRPISREKLQEQLGVSERAVRDADMMERGRLEGVNEAQEDAIIDRIVLSMTAQQRFNAVLKRERGKLNASHAKRKAALDEEVRQRVLKENAAYLADLEEMRKKAQADQEWYQELIGNHTPIFTEAEFMSIWRCLHSDSRQSVTPERLDAAFSLFNSKRVRLIGQK